MQHAPRHARIRAGMNIGVAKPFGMGQHGHARFLLHAQHQPLAAARNNEIDQPRGAQHGGNERAVRGGCVLHHASRQTRRNQSLAQGRIDRGRTEKAFAAAAQDHGVAGFDANGRGVRADIRARFVNHADDANRRRHTPDAQTVRPHPFLGAAAQRIGQTGDVLQAAGHGVDARGIQRQPVAHGRRAGERRHVTVIGRLNGRRMPAQCRARLAQGLVAGGRRQPRQGAGRGAGPIGGVLQGDVVGLVH